MIYRLTSSFAPKRKSNCRWTRKNRNVKSELGSKAMHRDIEHIDGAYTLREQSEVYDGNLIGDTATKMLELPRDNVVRSVTPSSMMKLAQLICCLLFVCIAAGAQAQAPFYEGKNILLVSGTDAGGAGDVRTRALLAPLKKHIPGHPNIVVQYMPGAGGRRAANYLYKSVKPDGLTMGAMITGMIQGTLFGESDVLYDIDKFIYLGSHARYAPYGFISRKGAGFTTKEKLAAATGIRIGAPSVGHSLYTMARLFAYMFDLKEPRFVTGYTPREIDFALERNEIDARVSILESLLTRNAHWLDKDMVDINATMDIPKDISYSHPRLAKLLEIEALARSNQERRLIALFRGARGTGQPFVLPPATPPDRVKILREAMRNAFADPDYVKSYEKLTAEPAMPIAPDEFEKQLREIPREPEIIDLFKKLSGSGPLPRR